MRAKSRPAGGFTLVELLVVITIIAMLMGMIFPAIGDVREAVKRSNCASNMKQIYTGLANYESAHGALPPGLVSCDAPGSHPVGGLSAGSGNASNCMGPNWVSNILGNIGERPLAENLATCMDRSHHTCDQCSKADTLGSIGTKPLQVLSCPSEDYIEEGDYLSELGYENLAKGNYAGCFGMEHFYNDEARRPEDYTRAQKEGVFEIVNVYQEMQRRQARLTASGEKPPTNLLPPSKSSDHVKLGGWKSGHGKGTKLGKDIPDGDSKTIMLSEVRAYPSSKDGRGAWAWGGMGGTAFTAKTPPNADGRGRPEFYDKIPICDANIDENDPMHCIELRRSFRVWAAARSNHPNLVNVMFADGHARNIFNSVDPIVWQAMSTKASGKREVGLELE